MHPFTTLTARRRCRAYAGHSKSSSLATDSRSYTSCRSWTACIATSNASVSAETAMRARSHACWNSRRRGAKAARGGVSKSERLRRQRGADRDRVRDAVGVWGDGVADTEPAASRAPTRPSPMGSTGCMAARCEADSPKRSTRSHLVLANTRP